MKLYLDDLRNPPDNSFTLVNTTKEAKRICEKTFPQFISFDHDLGENQESGFDFAKWIVQKDLDSNGKFIPDDFNFKVHSANPVGAKNIECLLNNYLSKKHDKF